MKVFLSILIAFTAVLSTAKLYAAEEIIVVSDEWGSYTNKDGSGYYFDLVREIYPAPDYSVVIKVVPYARSVKMVESGDAHLVLGIYDGVIPKKQMSKYVVERDLVDALVSPVLGKSWQGVNSLAGKNVVAKIDYAFDSVTDVKMNYSEKSSLESMVKMLQIGRADAVLDYEADLAPIIKKVKLDKSFTIQKAVIGSDIYFGFAADATSKKYLERFNLEFKKLWDAKKVHELMKKNVGATSSLPEKQ